MSFRDQYTSALKVRIFLALFILFFFAIGLAMTLNSLSDSEEKISPVIEASANKSCQDNPISPPVNMKWSAKCAEAFHCNTDDDCRNFFPNAITNCHQFEGATQTGLDWRCIVLEPAVVTVDPKSYLESAQ